MLYQTCIHCRGHTEKCASALGGENLQLLLVHAQLGQVGEPLGNPQAEIKISEGEAWLNLYFKFTSNN